MNESALRRLLARVAGGELDLEQALSELRTLPFTDLGYARVDHHRALRQGVPEVIFAPGKTAEQIVGIAESLQEKGHTVLATRIDEAQASIVCDALPGALYNSVARTVVIQGRVPTRDRQVAVVTAGTSDLAVAEEAVITLKCCGVGVVRINDVGVAGLHRLLAALPVLNEAHVVIVLAGMEGALASVVGGLVASPVIAVPTSVGYGAAFGGVAALLGMLTSCASGVTVVNIDNGFGAAMAAVRMLDASA